ncbi:MAG: decaprenyl-phosphate phosphoribosyltransferase, partial [Spirochaetales bacterium]|nr:decaprenyl-phosphate phosphoribosyltransferase [Spirochaetales bacterium]
MLNIFSKTFLRLIRVKQWMKNIFIFAPLIFSHHLLNIQDITKTVTVFFAFSLVSVLVYIINDIHDCKQDAIHPEKKSRPIASGTVSKSQALITGIILFIAGISIAFLVKRPQVIITLLAYLIINMLYTFFLKQIAILDVFIIAVGFCIRVIIGAVAIDVQPSQWIISTTFAISLVLGFGKRRHELLSLKQEAVEHREILGEYTPRLLDIMIAVSSSITAISYMFYTMESGISKLFYTFPLVLYALFRYLYLIYDKNKGGKPEEDLINDKGIIITVILWGLMIIGILYYP